MGFTPAQVNEMSMWQWFAALHGYIDANSPKESVKLTSSEAEDIFAWIEQDGAGPSILSTQTYWWDERGPVPMGVVSFTP